MVKLTEWLGAAPDLAEADATRLIRLLNASDKTATPDRKQRHENVVSLLEEGDEPWTPPTQVLIALCKVGEHQAGDAHDAGDEALKETCGRAMLLAMGALNIVGACDAEKLRVRALFRTLDETPTGRVAQRFELYEYARDLVRKVGSDDRLEMAAAPASAAEVERHRKEAEEKEEMRGAMAEGFAAAEAHAREAAAAARIKAKGAVPDRRLDVWMVAKSFYLHGGLILVAFFVRLVWDHLILGGAAAQPEDGSVGTSRGAHDEI